MPSKNYIPRNDDAFFTWVKNLYVQVFTHATAWKILPPDDAINDLIDDFENKLIATKKPNRGRVDVMKKDEARKILEKECRKFVQGFLARNPFVSDPEREMMGLNIYDVTPTTVPAPTTPAEGDLTFPAVGLVEVKNIRSATGLSEKTTVQGARVYFGILGEPGENVKFGIDKPPKTGDDLPHSIFTRQRKIRFDFAGESGRKVFVCLRFENSKGQAGPWGSILQAFIP